VRASKQVMACLEAFDPRFESSGLDEAFVEVTDFVAERRKKAEEENEGNETTFFSALDAANEIRAAVREATSLPSSCGVACNKLLAKIASDLGKPDGAFAVPRDPGEIARFVAELPVRKVPGIGRVTERILDGALGVKTCAQLYASRGLVFCLFGKATAEFLLAASLGVGSDEHNYRGDDCGDGEGSEYRRKGLSAERTFAPTADPGFLEGKLGEIAERVAQGVKAEGLRPKTLTLKIKFATFDVVSRAASAGNAGGGGGGGGGGGLGGGANSDPAVSALCAGVSSFSGDDAGRIAAVAVALFRAELRSKKKENKGPPAAAAAASAAGAAPPVRLLGIRLSNWENALVPLERGQRRLDDVLAAAALQQSKEGGKEEEEGGAEGGGEEDEEEEERAASEVVAAAAAASAPAAPAKSSNCWTCSLCTFAGTRLFSLRCDVCGTPRGAKGCGSLLAAGAVAEERAVANRGGGGGGTKVNNPKKRSSASSSAAAAAAAPLDAFFVKKKK